MQDMCICLHFKIALEITTKYLLHSLRNEWKSTLVVLFNVKIFQECYYYGYMYIWGTRQWVLNVSIVNNVIKYLRLIMLILRSRWQILGNDTR